MCRLDYSVRVFSCFESEEESSPGTARVFSCVARGLVSGGSRRAKPTRGCCFFSLLCLSPPRSLFVYIFLFSLSPFFFSFFFKLFFGPISAHQERKSCVCNTCERGRLEDRLSFFFLGSSWQSFVVLGVQQRRQAAAASNTRQRAGVRDTIQGNRAIRLFVVASIRVLRNARINVSVTVQDVKRGNTRQVSIFLVASAKR